MLKFFRLPFATTGDKTAVPDPVDSNGNVSYSQGYGFDYQRQKTDPAAKNIDRAQNNQILFDITTAIAEIQSQGVPDFITAALNGGTAYSYAANALVRYSGDVYISLAAANTALPSDATKWALLPTPARIQGAYNVSAVAGGTADALTCAFSPAIAALPASPGTLAVLVRAGAANATATPTFSPDGLTAKTIVKGANQSLVAGDIAGAGHWLDLQYDATLDKWVLQNPATGVTSVVQQVQVRQTVSSGATDAAGLANFLSAGTGLAVNLAATATPVNINIAAGFGANGAVDYVARFTADVASAWGSLTASSTLFLYVDRNTSTGAITQGFSALTPVYSTVAPSGPATDQHWFDLTAWQMKRWSGSAWAVVQRVFVGEAVTGGSTVTSVATYALNGRYVSADTAWPAVATAVSLTSNLGVGPTSGQTPSIFVKVEAVCQTAENGYSVGDVVEPYTNPVSTSFTPLTPWKRRNTVGFTTGANWSLQMLNLTTGASFNATLANWKYRVTAQRGF